MPSDEYYQDKELGMIGFNSFYFFSSFPFSPGEWSISSSVSTIKMDKLTQSNSLEIYGTMLVLRHHLIVYQAGKVEENGTLEIHP